MSVDIERLAERIRERMYAADRINGTVAVQLGDETIFIDGCQNPATVVLRDGEADCTVRMSADVLQQILDGKRNGFIAFLSGKIAVHGDMSVAVKLRPLLAAG